MGPTTSHNARPQAAQQENKHEHEHEQAAASWTAVAAVGIGAGALLGGLLADHYGLSGAMALGAITTLATALVVICWRRRSQK
jgi:predicted MFS family arabinose efflux permease